jgi:hypothetical protein
MVLLGGVEPLRGGPSRRKLSHWGCALEEDIVTLAPPPLLFASWLIEGEQLLSLWAPAMMCYLSTGPNQQGRSIMH